MPALAHQPKDRTEQAPQQSALGEEHIEVALDEALAAPELAEAAMDGGEDEDIGDRDREQEKGGDARPDQPAHLFEPVEPALQQGRRKRDRRHGHDHHRRMPEGEEEADGNRPLALLHELARHIVDGGDVVGVHGMTQAEAVGEEGGAEQQRIGAERQQRPEPSQRVRREQQAENPGNPGA